MASTLRRLIDCSATCLMCSGRLFRALHLPPSGVGRPPEFRHDDDFPAKWNEGLTDKFFIQQRAVDFSGIEECNSRSTAACRRAIISCLSVWRAVGPAHSHTAKSDGRYFEIPSSKFALLHCDYSFVARSGGTGWEWHSAVSELLITHAKDTECRSRCAFPILPILCLILSHVLILCTV
jgi:hypothetical protein